MVAVVVEVDDADGDDEQPASTAADVPSNATATTVRRAVIREGPTDRHMAPVLADP